MNYFHWQKNMNRNSETISEKQSKTFCALGLYYLKTRSVKFD